MSGGHVSRSCGYNNYRPYASQKTKNGQSKQTLKGRHVKKMQTDNQVRKEKRMARMQEKLAKKNETQDTAELVSSTVLFLNVAALMQ